MKHYIYILGVILSFISCTNYSNVLEVRVESYLKENNLDTTFIELLRKYMTAHNDIPSYVIMTNDEMDFRDAYSAKKYLVIGPAYTKLFGTGEFEFDMPVPTNYMKIDNHIIFLEKKSESIQNEKITSFYESNSVSLKNVGKDGSPYLQPTSEEYISKSIAIRKDSINNAYVVSNKVDTLLVKFSEVNILPGTHGE